MVWFYVPKLELSHLLLYFTFDFVFLWIWWHKIKDFKRNFKLEKKKKLRWICVSWISSRSNKVKTTTMKKYVMFSPSFSLSIYSWASISSGKLHGGPHLTLDLLLMEGSTFIIISNAIHFRHHTSPIYILIYLSC